MTSNGSQALYQQVKQYILDRINSGTWPPGSKVPSENQLVADLNVSRMTANRALRELTSEGFLHRQQGVGTFVSKPKPQAEFMEIKSIAEEITRRGGIYSAKVHLLAEEIAEPEIAAIMEMEPGDKVYHSLIVHHEDGQPVQVSDRFVNPRVVPDYINQDFTKITPNQYLIKTVPSFEAEHILEAILPDKTTQGLLRIGAHEPCILLRRRTWTGSLVVTRNRQVYPGSRFRLHGRMKYD